MNYITTGLNDQHWKNWGNSWIISLKMFGNHPMNQVIVVGFNLSKTVKKQIEEFGSILIEGEFTGDYQSDIFHHTAQYIIDNKLEGKIVYWDIDCFFQEDVTNIFKEIEDKFVISDNYASGFLAAKTERWIYLKDIKKTINFFDDHDIFNYLTSKNLNLSKVDNTWNFTDIPKLKDINNKLCYLNVIQKVIHPAGSIKMFLENKNIFFHERYKELFVQNKKLIGKLIRKGNQK